MAFDGNNMNINKYKDFSIKLFLQVAAVIIAFLPTAGFLLIKAALGPDGFWQQFVVYGLGIYFFGALQLVLLITLVVISPSLWE
jgi:hypothetical protein